MGDWLLVSFIRLKSWLERNDENTQETFNESFEWMNLVTEHAPNVIAMIGGR